MPPKSLAPDTRVTVDRATNTIVLTRTFTAPREDVFEAWTQPEHVACWWDASGARLSLCEIDLRPGGAFRFVHQGQPDVPPFSGVYREIVPPEKLVFEAMGAIAPFAGPGRTREVSLHPERRTAREQAKEH